MKGLELSELYFRYHGMPMIREKFRSYADRIAVGMVGDGSECFGFDDQISRDHDWGPSFCIWLLPEDHEAISERLQEALDDLPQTFAGHGPRNVSEWGHGRVGVFEIVSFYKRFTGMDHLPDCLEDWIRLPESYLAACTNGRVFHDPLGEFTRWRRELLKFYPEDVRLKKIAARCMTIGQSGQYNFKRCSLRKDYFAVHYVETKFCFDVMSLVYLLNKRYTPYFKWVHRCLKELPILGRRLHYDISQLVTAKLYDEKEAVMAQVCVQIASELQSQGLSDSNSSFLLDHGSAVQMKIKDTVLRQTSVWVG